MTLWVSFIPLLLVALAFVVWPLYRHAGSLTALLASVIVAFVALSAGLYYAIGDPEIPSGAGNTPDVTEMVSALAKRLEDEPGDVNEWTLLGRSYMNLEQYDKSIAAYNKAIELEQGQNAQTLVALALVHLAAGSVEASDQATSLLENAVAIAPNDPNALFYSGFAAADRGDTDLAADRWEVLLGLNAPPEIQALLQEKISVWRGVAPPVEATANAPLRDVVAISLSASAEAVAAVPADATVFVIARDPGQPSPPIAVTRRRLSDLPSVVTLTDRDSMVPGRSLSAFKQFELVARISVSGQPMAQPGDWFGSLIFSVRPDGQNTTDLVIDQQMP